jgi:hypothetical protein
MKKSLFAFGATAAMLIAGCDATMASAVNTALQNQQGKTPSAAPASATPNATASANANASVGTASGMFASGRKWHYGIATKAAMGVNTSGDLIIEVANVNGSKATLKTTVTLAGVTTNNSTEVDTSGNNPWASVNVGANANVGTSAPAKTSEESVTVAAGTFACTKLTYVVADAQADSTVDIWLNKDKGMVKEIVTVKPKVAAALPAGLPAGLTGGLNMDMTVTTTIELKSVTP